MMKISAIVIAKDEEVMIADCLDSLSFCDEIIVVNNLSNDHTVEIAQRMGAKVFDCDSDSFSTLRNFGLKKAGGEWALYVDADERVSAELVAAIKSQISRQRRGSQRAANLPPKARLAKGGKSQLAAFKIMRKNFYLGNHEWPKIEKMERLFKKDKLKGWKGELHEGPIVEGQIGEIEGFLLHYTHRNLFEMLEKTIKWSKIEAKLRFDHGHPKMAWWRFPRVMISTFFDYYIRQEGYKVGTAGLIESMYQSFSIFVTYARLWELQNKKND